MKTRLALLAVPIFAGFLAAGASMPAAGQAAGGTGSAGEGPTGLHPSAPLPGENMNIRNLYRLRCGTCHGANGEGTASDWPKLAPPLRANPFVQNAPASAIIRVIRKGRYSAQRLYRTGPSYPNMPAFGAELVPNADELVAFLKGDLQK